MPTISRIVPSPDVFQIEVEEATPRIIKTYAKTYEQALLAKVRYNRLIDRFLNVTAHSIQCHLRTSVPRIGQVEVDELYVGTRNAGQQFIIPVQAIGGNHRIAVTQIRQHLRLCKHAYPNFTRRLVAVQLSADDVITMFELMFQDDELKKLDEKQYRLVAGNEITGDDLRSMTDASD